MRNWQEDYEGSDEIPDEYLEEESLEKIFSKEIEIPEVAWADDIRKIENPEIQQNEIERAEKYLEKEKILRNKVNTGEISVGQYDSELRPIRAKSATRCALESVDLTYDHLGDLAENHDLLVAGNLEILDQKERLNKTIDAIGEDRAMDVADRMLEDERLSEKGHDLISRQIRIHKK